MSSSPQGHEHRYERHRQGHSGKAHDRHAHRTPTAALVWLADVPPSWSPKASGCAIADPGLRRLGRSCRGRTKQPRVTAARRLHERAAAFGDLIFRYVSPRRVAVTVGLAVAALQLHRASTDIISPYDEGYHLSYVQYVASGHLPHVGDPLNTWSREAFSCHPVYPYGVVTAVPCGEIAAPSAYPEGGTYIAGGWPPLFYAYAAIVVRVLGIVGVDPLYAARAAACLLWAVGAAALVLVAARFGASLSSAAAAGLVAGVIPVATLLGAYVTRTRRSCCYPSSCAARCST